MFSALLFLYREVLQQRLPWIADVVRAKRPRKVPVVFTQLEARAVLARMMGTTRLMVAQQLTKQKPPKKESENESKI